MTEYADEGLDGFSGCWPRAGKSYGFRDPTRFAVKHELLGFSCGAVYVYQVQHSECEAEIHCKYASVVLIDINNIGQVFAVNNVMHRPNASQVMTRRHAEALAIGTI